MAMAPVAMTMEETTGTRHKPRGRAGVGDAVGGLTDEVADTVEEVEKLAVAAGDADVGELAADGGDLAGELFLELVEVVLDEGGDGLVLFGEGFEIEGDHFFQLEEALFDLGGLLPDAGVDGVDDGFEYFVIDRGGRAAFELGDAPFEFRSAVREGFGRWGGGHWGGGLWGGGELHADAEGDAVPKCDGQAAPDGRIAAVLHIT